MYRPCIFGFCEPAGSAATSSHRHVNVVDMTETLQRMLFSNSWIPYGLDVLAHRDTPGFPEHLHLLSTRAGVDFVT